MNEQIGFDINGMGSCFKVFIGDKYKGGISTDPFVMASGDILHVGDKFTAIDKSGSAGCPPIVLTPPWYQEYRGRIMIPECDPWSKRSDGIQREMILFSAHNPETNEKVFLPRKGALKRGVQSQDHTDGYYIGYYNHGGGELFYSSAAAGRVIKCKSIKRYYQ
ncbi:hypothetical protein VXS06_14620 [Photobacterium toruni]|uniref:Uncharacterized protein n=1 Tax=Photobacterium toruni TaxID=1935446 RepID=A0ABU6L9V6_9GAMM|nr:hypothetical protein [Photobacterium toruni]